MLPQVDTLIVGAGAVGLATGLALSENSNDSLAIIEAEPSVARHQTGNNSGVIHSGLYYKPGSYKAKLCVEGRDLLYRFCEQHGVKHDRCGKIVVALDESEIPRLDELIRRGNANGLKHLTRVSIDEVREREPNVTGIAATYVEETGIVNYKTVSEAYRKVLDSRSVPVILGSRLHKITIRANEIVAHTSKGDVVTKHLINCAGLHSDRVAKLCGMRPKAKIIPFRGEYYELRESAQSLVKNLIYPVPDPRFPFLGVHFTRMIDGGVEAGPNAVLALARHGYKWRNLNLSDLFETLGFKGFRIMARRYWKMGLGEMHRSMSKAAFVRALQRLVPKIQSSDLVRAGAGVRAQAVMEDGSLVDDFLFERGDRMLHVLNAPSPAATASLAIGREVARMAREQFQNHTVAM